MADRNAFVCGNPIAHSRSPKIHNYWLNLYGIEGTYCPIDILPEAFPDFVRTLKEQGLAGGNVTLPHKEAAFRLAERPDETAELIGAANTLWFENGELFATNTDAHGFAANLDEYASGWEGNGIAVVLGSGGAARAVIYALIQRGFRDIRIVNRTLARATELADRFGKNVSAQPVAMIDELMSDADLLVNTTSLGMHGNVELPANPDHLPDNAIVTDLVYVPLETPLLAAAKRRGLKTVDGLGMLLHQAVPGFEKWFGKRPEVTPELRALIVADMEKHA
ncbi:shikimate dehydrogenase [Mesorhizobium sp. SB112]|uniref:shikimate dehydrogenase n=1 Tax=Mesorhizobium sp. SB112 TaxID=3151853 RepID=UPI0032644545